MSQGYEEDINMYEEAKGPPTKQLDNKTLLRPIHTLNYLESPPMVGAGTQLADVFDVMARNETDAVLVVEDGKVAGIFSGRDALMERLYTEKDLYRPVRDYMTPEPQCLTPDDSIALAMNCMVQAGYRHVPLVDRNEKPVGMVRQRDVVGYLAGFFPKEVLNAPPHSECKPPDHSRVGG